MATSNNQAEVLSSALLRAVGIDPETTFAVTYTHRVGEIGVLTVEHPVWRANSHDLESVRQTWYSADPTKPGSPSDLPGAVCGVCGRPDVPGVPQNGTQPPKGTT